MQIAFKTDFLQIKTLFFTLKMVPLRTLCIYYIIFESKF
jgi:hypothetical protein